MHFTVFHPLGGGIPKIYCFANRRNVLLEFHVSRSRGLASVLMNQSFTFFTICVIMHLRLLITNDQGCLDISTTVKTETLP
jgi:hypothetical protein